MADTPSRSLQALLNVQELVLDQLDTDALVGRIADEILRAVAGADGAAVAVVGLAPTPIYTACSGKLTGYEGKTVTSRSSLAVDSLRLGAVLRCNDVDHDHRLDARACHEAGIASTMSAPLQNTTGTIGVVELVSTQPDAFSDRDVILLQQLSSFMGAAMHSAELKYHMTAATFSNPALLPRGIGGLQDEDLTLLSACTEFVARSLGIQVDEYREAAAARARIRRLLAHGGPATVLQPIFDLTARRPVGYEALARFNVTPRRAPHLWFAEAAAVGLGLELETATLRSALEVLKSLPDDTYLSINLTPEGATTEAIVELLEHVPPRRLVIEVTEHTVVQDYDQLNESLRPARDRGTRVAVDDAGAGYASMRHILKLRPDCIKLDMGITSGIDTDPVRRALAASLISFAHEIDATLVAEGIETQAEMDMLCSLGVSFGQGYYLGRPAPLRRARPRHLSLAPEPDLPEAASR